MDEDKDSAAHKLKLDKFNFLSNESYRYRNYGKKSIIPGQRIEVVFFQPDFNSGILKISKRKRAGSLLQIFTDDELIIVKSEKGPRKGQTKYICNYFFIPIKKIMEIKLEITKYNYYSQQIYLFGGRILTFKILFTNFDLEIFRTVIRRLHKTGDDYAP